MMNATLLTNIPNVIQAPRTDHSQKPEQFFEFANRLGDALSGPRIELFARKRRDGWDCWGAEVEIARVVERNFMSQGLL